MSSSSINNSYKIMEAQNVIVITGSTRGIDHGLAKEFLKNVHSRL